MSDTSPKKFNLGDCVMHIEAPAMAVTHPAVVMANGIGIVMELGTQYNPNLRVLFGTYLLWCTPLALRPLEDHEG